MARYYICDKCGVKHDYNYICKRKYKVGSVQEDKQREKNRFYCGRKWRATREYVLNRDNYTCQRCFIKYNIITNDRLEGHHIKSREHYPELEYDTDNIICLCRQCNNALGVKDELDFEWAVQEVYINI